MMMEAPQNPAGPLEREEDYSAARREVFIATLAEAPAVLRRTAEDLTLAQLDTVYRNWTIRQIVQHLADSHVHSYVRFKWALSEDEPTIKAYDENEFAKLPDATAGDISAPLALFAGVHACWVKLLRGMSDENFSRGFMHPQTGKRVSLHEALCVYAWHGRHHTAQIQWLRDQHGW